MAIHTLRELFVHELRDIYYAEHMLVGTLGELAAQASNPEIQQAFLRHRDETQGHIARLNDVFAAMGDTPSARICYGVEGLVREQKMFVSEGHPAPQLLDLYNLAAAQKSERYEITAYEGLIEMACSLDTQSVASLLQANLREEEQALQTLKGLATSFQLHNQAPDLAMRQSGIAGTTYYSGREATYRERG